MIVVDASIAVQWVVPEEEGQSEAESVLGRSDLIAPDLLLVEVASALRRKVKDGEAVEAQALSGLEQVARRVKTEVVSYPVARRALELALQLSHPVYDCVYVAFTEVSGGLFLTRDVELMRRLRRAGYGRLLAELPLGPVAS